MKPASAIATAAAARAIGFVLMAGVEAANWFAIWREVRRMEWQRQRAV